MLSNSIKETLRKASIDGLDPNCIFAYSIPKDKDAANKKANKIEVLFRDVSNTPSDFASNKYQSRSQSVKMQIFYPAQYDLDTDLLEDSILRYLEDKENLEASRNTGVNENPLTGLLYTTINLDRVVLTPSR